MLRTTALVIAGMLAFGSASALAAQQSSPPTKHPAPHDTMSVSEHMTGSPTHMWSMEQVKEMQLALIQLKLYDGKATGMMNTDTEEALKKFQHGHGMAATGMLSDSVLVLLHKARMEAMHGTPQGKQ